MLAESTRPLPPTILGSQHEEPGSVNSPIPYHAARPLMAVHLPSSSTLESQL